VEDNKAVQVGNTVQRAVKHSAADLLDALEAPKFLSGTDQMGINSYALSKMRLMLELWHAQLDFSL
jgi:L-asparaginase II